MAIRAAIVGIDPLQREWLQAARTLRAAGEIDIVAAAHRTLALAKDLSDQCAEPGGITGAGDKQRIPAYDDLRLMLNERAPQILVMDRPPNMPIELLASCVQQKIGVMSVGPPVETVAEAQTLGEALESRPQLLDIWPRMIDTFGYKQAVGAEDFIRPVRFAGGAWLGMNHALARTVGYAAESSPGGPIGALQGAGGEGVRSLSVLAWDALATLIDLIDVPTTIYGAARGSVGLRDTFADISGSVSVTLRFPEDAVATLTLSDQAPATVMPGGRRELLLFGHGMAQLTPESYSFHDAGGRLIDEGSAGTGAGGGGGTVVETLREFLRTFAAPASTVRRDLQLEAVAATMEALVVSHRTGQPESPERFRRLRR
jgi:predicted dehydrogenase